MGRMSFISFTSVGSHVVGPGCDTSINGRSVPRCHWLNHCTDIFSSPTDDITQPIAWKLSTLFFIIEYPDVEDKNLRVISAGRDSVPRTQSFLVRRNSYAAWMSVVGGRGISQGHPVECHPVTRHCTVCRNEHSWTQKHAWIPTTMPGSYTQFRPPSDRSAALVWH